MYKIISSIKLIGIIGIFLWISFFAPLVGGQYQSLFLIFITSLLLVLLILNNRLYKIMLDKKDLPLWIFLFSMIGGIVNIQNPSITYWHFWGFIFPIPFLYFFAKSAFEERYDLLILRSLCLMGLMVCLYGIIEFITGQNFIYKDLVHNFCYEAFKGRRMMSTHIHPAPLGTYLVAIFPLALVLILKEKKVFFKRLAIIFALIIFISIILTFSRGAFLGAVISMSIMLSFLFKRNRIFFIPLLILLVAAIIIISSLLFYYGYHYFYRFGFQGLSAAVIYTSKIDRFASILNILKDHPFFGLGLGHYRVFFDYYLPHLANVTGQLSKVPDCMYIALLTETGLIGFAGFVLFISFLFKSIWHKLKLVSGYEDRLLIVGFLSGFVGVLVAFLTYDGLYWIAPSYLFWTYAGVLAHLSVQKLE